VRSAGFPTEGEAAVIREALVTCRPKAERLGAMFAWWDFIFDSERLLRGEDGILSAEDLAGMAREWNAKPARDRE